MVNVCFSIGQQQCCNKLLRSRVTPVSSCGRTIRHHMKLCIFRESISSWLNRELLLSAKLRVWRNSYLGTCRQPGSALATARPSGADLCRNVITYSTVPESCSNMDFLNTFLFTVRNPAASCVCYVHSSIYSSQPFGALDSRIKNFPKLRVEPKLVGGDLMNNPQFSNSLGL